MGTMAGESRWAMPTRNGKKSAHAVNCNDIVLPACSYSGGKNAKLGWQKLCETTKIPIDAKLKMTKGKSRQTTPATGIDSPTQEELWNIKAGPACAKFRAGRKSSILEMPNNNAARPEQAELRRDEELPTVAKLGAKIKKPEYEMPETDGRIPMHVRYCGGEKLPA